MIELLYREFYGQIRESTVISGGFKKGLSSVRHIFRLSNCLVGIKTKGEHLAFKLLKGDQVAEMLNISRSQAYGMMKRGEIPTIRFGKSVRVRIEDLEEFLLDHQNVDENKVLNTQFSSKHNLLGIDD